MDVYDKLEQGEYNKIEYNENMLKLNKKPKISSDLNRISDLNDVWN